MKIKDAFLWTWFPLFITQKPIALGVEFLNDGHHINYELSIGGAAFLGSSKSEPYIEFEALIIDGKDIFRRNKQEIVCLFFHEI